MPNEIGEDITIFPEVIDEIATPWLSFPVGRLCGIHRERIDLRQSTASGCIELSAKFGIANHSERIAKTCDVVGLAGRQQGDDALLQRIGQAQGREVSLIRLKNEVAMNLVGNEDEVVLFAEIGKLFDFLPERIRAQEGFVDCRE